MVRRGGSTGAPRARKLPTREAMVTQAASACAIGALDDAEDALRRAASVCSGRVRGSRSWARIAAYELALLLSQRGRHSEADELLSGLGFIYKLSPIIFDRTCIDRSKGAANAVAAFDHALPPSIFEPLCNAFSETSPFWAEHGYPTPCFFSYNEPLHSSSSSTKSRRRLRHQPLEAPLIRAVAECVRPLAESAFPTLFNIDSTAKKRRTIVSVEWWAHLRQTDSGGGHQLHFDLDEAGLSMLPEGAAPAHPLVSCVLYLTGPNAGVNSDVSDMAPTIVTDQSLAHGSQAAHAWLCPPALNRLLLFDGGLLHGVVPCSTKTGVNPEPRVTLMLGLWGDSPRPTLHKGGGSLGPNMPMPGAGTTSPAQTPRWPALLKSPVPLADPDSGRKRPMPTSGLHGPVSPVWVPVPSTATAASNVAKRGRRSGSAGVQFFGRWFLDHEPSLLQEMVVAEARRSSAPMSEPVAPCMEATLAPGGGISMAPPALEVEEVSMEELLRLRNAAR